MGGLHLYKLVDIELSAIVLMLNIFSMHKTSSPDFISIILLLVDKDIC